ncbi:spondin domain-containing protein [Pseudoduganella ginsengisoli]|uniref:Spondin domain-containing protein n=1 Tax=Pseudoduganella ginsengisoli TaxID=1462440 RepID=A0A6L6Q1Y6_9BURK|nr:spondin domain-containing protein [Pseudoduganella ginsengisoli]MTW03258.1 hypothetical protein [Pseudoduganella ginsengisoli]
MTNSKRYTLALGAIAAAAMLSACNGGSHAMTETPAPVTPPAPANAMFDITLVNLTAGQPLSPMVAVAHSDGFSMFNVGEPASVALEHIAEAGETTQMAALANDSKSVYATAVASGGPLLPGPGNSASVTLTIPAGGLANARLSMASMLGNTNDGFAGLSAQSLSSLAVGATMTVRLLSYDAGTERNTESADTVPGPATAKSGGKREGFNATRDDIVNTVHLHPGIVSSDDGLATSALTQAQRWDNPVALLTVKRTQ